MRNFHCCATCKNFKVVKSNEGTKRICDRLGFETQPGYKFDCWDPKESVVKLMEVEDAKKH